MHSYLERPPLPELAHLVRTVWVQRTGESAYVQRHLPTGGVEVHWPFGGEPQILGPLTGPLVETIPARTIVVGVRFRPGAAPLGGMALEKLVDRRVPAHEVWGPWVDRVGEAMAAATMPASALGLFQTHLLRGLSAPVRPDPLVLQAVQLLLPWQPHDVGAVAAHLGLSASQLRRRCVHSIGLGPKALQRTLRFQGFLALAQAGVTASGQRSAHGMAGLAVDVGYADQAHLGRECLRLAGITPGRLLGGDIDRCSCGHEHAPSYRPFLATRNRAPIRV
jgi:AraC-like DNA-binding protein